MATDGQPGATPEPSGAKPGSTEDDQQQPKPNGEAQQQGDTTDDSDDARALANARAAAKRAAKERDEYRAELETLRAKDLPEAEKNARRLAEMEEENKRLAAALVERDVQTEVAKAATKLGVVDAEVAMLLLREEDAIDFDSEGKPLNVEAAVKDLIKHRPYLAKAVAAGADAGAGTRPGAAPGTSMNDILRRAAGHQG